MNKQRMRMSKREKEKKELINYFNKDLRSRGGRCGMD